MRTLKSWIFTVFFTGFSSLTYAAGELLPKFKSEAEANAFIGRVQRQLPFATRNNLTLLNTQRKGIDHLVANFPGYKRMMAEKAGPYIFDVFEVETQQEQTYTLEESRYTEVLEYVRTNLEKELALVSPRLASNKKIEALEARAFAALKEAFANSSDSVRGIIVGLSQLLPNEEKAIFFKLGEPAAQLDYLEKKGISDEALKNSKFRPETLGLTPENITAVKVFSLARDRLQSSTRMFRILAYLQTVRKLGLLNEADRVRILSKPATLNRLLTPTDFNFAHRNSDPLVLSVIEKLGGKDEKSTTQTRQQIEAFQNSFSRLSFKVGTQQNKVPKKLGAIYEVHPYLGIHRGCLGGDCSTSNSPMFPYSPWEHVFYIQDAKARYVGYISATLVEIRGQSALYVKDITGPNLSPLLAEAALYTLNSAISKYGAELFAIASPQFTNGQNSNQALREMLQKYNKEKLVALSFPDKELRQDIANVRAVFNSTPTYDSADVHRQGVIFQGLAEVADKFTSNVRSGTLPIPKKTSLLRDLIDALNENLHLNTPPRGSFGALSANTIAQAKMIFNNNRRINVEAYYNEVGTFLKTYGINIDPAFLKQFEPFFYAGHLASSDAFNANQKKTVVDTSYRYFFELYQQNVSLGSMLSTYAIWHPQISVHPQFSAMLKVMSERLRPADVLILSSFASYGSKEAKEILKNPKNQDRIEESIVAILQRGLADFGFDPYAASQFLGIHYGANKLKQHLTTAMQMTVNNFAEALRMDFQFFQMDWKELRNPYLRNQIQAAFVSTTDSYDGPYRQSTLQILKENVNRNEIANHSFSRSVFQLKSAKVNMNSIVKSRVQYLTENPSESNLLEIYSYHMMEFASAAEALILESMHALRFEVFSRVATRGVFDNPQAQQMYVELGKYASTRKISLANLRGIFSTYFPTAQEANKFYNAVMESMGLTVKDLLKMPTLLPSITQRWINLPDAFTSPKTEILDLSLLLLEGIIRTQDHPAIPQGFTNNLEYLKQKKSFQDFSQRLKQEFSSDNCKGCAQILVSLALEWHVEMKDLVTPENIRHLLNSSNASLKAFGVSAAIDLGLWELVTKDHLLASITGFGNYFQDKTPQLKNALHRQLINSYLRLKNVDPQFLDHLRNIARISAIDEVALKAAVAYTRLGGDRKVALKELSAIYNRWEYSYKAKPETVELYSELQGAPKLGSKSRSCQRIFNAG